MLTRKLAIAAVVVLGCVTAGYAQQTENCSFGVCINNNRPDGSVVTTGFRSPGRMVTDGVARTLLNTRNAQSRIEITEPAPEEPDIYHDFLADVIEGTFDAANDFLAYLTNLLLERAGLDPVPPDDDDDGRPPKPGGR